MGSVGTGTHGTAPRWGRQTPYSNTRGKSCFGVRTTLCALETPNEDTCPSVGCPTVLRDVWAPAAKSCCPHGARVAKGPIWIMWSWFWLFRPRAEEVKQTDMLCSRGGWEAQQLFCLSGIAVHALCLPKFSQFPHPALPRSIPPQGPDPMILPDPTVKIFLHTLATPEYLINCVF